MFTFPRETLRDRHPICGNMDTQKPLNVPLYNRVRLHLVRGGEARGQRDRQPGRKRGLRGLPRGNLERRTGDRQRGGLRELRPWQVRRVRERVHIL